MPRNNFSNLRKLRSSRSARRFRHLGRRNDLALLKEYLFRASVIAAIALILLLAWNIARPGIRVRVNADTVAAFRVPHRAIGALKEHSNNHGIPFPELFALFNAENDFFPENSAVFDLTTLEQQYVTDFHRLKRRYNSRSIAPYVTMFRNLFDDIEEFPIPQGWYEDEASVMFGNSWGVEHNFQGNRMHMGAAIIDRENMRGRVPIVSMTHGTVNQAGWCNQLGYFVEVTTRNETLFLYAHLDSLSTGLSAGQIITPGQPIGWMGNTGGGRNGRSFPVHLHLAIRPNVSFTRGEFWINPYPFLRYLEAR